MWAVLGLAIDAGGRIDPDCFAEWYDVHLATFVFDFDPMAEVDFAAGSNLVRHDPPCQLDRKGSGRAQVLQHLAVPINRLLILEHVEAVP